MPDCEMKIIFIWHYVGKLYSEMDVKIDVNITENTSKYIGDEPE